MEQAGRELYWNISVSWPMWVLAVIGILVLFYGIFIHVKRLRVGQPADRANRWWQRTVDFLRVTVIEIFLHRKFFGIEKPLRPREFFPGTMHFFIFTGFVIFLLATIIGTFEFLLKGNVYLIYSLIVDIFGILAVIGVLMALWRRYIRRPARLDNRWEDLGTLIIILVILLTGFLMEGLRLAATELQTHPDWAVWSPGGWVLGKAFSGMSQGTILGWHKGLWWFHIVLGMGLFAYVALVNSRLFHVLWDPINIFFRNLGPKGGLTPIDLENTEHFGADKIEDFTWKRLLDLDACTRCGRCQDACPAYLSGKQLNPKAVIQDLKKHLYTVYPGNLSLKKTEKRAEMLRETIEEEVIWDCTTCRACQQACPIYVEHVDKIVDMRRNLVMEQSSSPKSAQDALKSLSTRSHPYRGTTATRTTWCEDLEVNILAENQDVDLVYWVGCSAALDDRNMKVAQATTKILKAAGIRFGILGDEEACCGDPARRMGDEYLFQTLCQQNIEILKGYNVKKILTSCPHCYHSLKVEYPQFDGNFEVIHHTQFIAGLLKEGRLKVGANIMDRVAYHDSCYLGRYHDIYEEPRQILKGLGVSPVELPRHGTNSFCCGGGGGHVWMEEEPDKRVSLRRTDEVIGAGVDCLATACPYCLTMFVDAIKTREKDESIKAKDLIEIVAEALDKTS